MTPTKTPAQAPTAGNGEYYSLSGRPLRRPRPTALLEILMPDGTWQHWSDPRRLWGEAERVSPEEFQRLCQEYMSQGAGA